VVRSFANLSMLPCITSLAPHLLPIVFVVVATQSFTHCSYSPDPPPIFESIFVKFAFEISPSSQRHCLFINSTERFELMVDDAERSAPPLPFLSCILLSINTSIFPFNLKSHLAIKSAGSDSF